ncbi:MAG: hypothetical protein GF383_06140 [Candidatus Lokiarchaeota archaeon]|nr:hypothetical protein [Candidatus Lokiarchaeota archaeon]MBD3339526.1 hypothetical protein [Candidatus Lokiarchaeota archaeon]
MPTIGHIIYGLCLIIPILHYSKDEKFNYKVAFIFLANNIFGPDIVFLFFITPFHSILGFLILGIPYSLVFSYSSRFSLKKSDMKYFPLKFVDDGIREVNWKNSYLLTSAGGISHFFIDQFFHWEKSMWIWPGISIHHDQMLSWGGPAYHTATPLIIIGNIIVVSTILLSLFIFTKGSKMSFLMLISITFLSIFLMLGITTNIYMGERELAVIVFSYLYILIPLYLLMHVAKEVRDHPNQTPDIPKFNRNSLLYVVASISVLISIFFIVYSFFAITYAHIFAKMLGSSPTQSVNDVAYNIVLIGYFVLVLSIILLISSLGLFFKIQICRYIVILLCSYLLIIGFPFAIALFLCENDVRVLFRSNG